MRDDFNRRFFKIMRNPTIDELLDRVGSIYELTMLAAKEATRIRMKDRDTEEPLQKALERISDGKVRGKFLSNDEMRSFEREEKDRKEVQSSIREKNVLPPPHSK